MCGSLRPQAGAVGGVDGLPASVCPRPWGRNSTSPADSGTGLVCGWMSQHDPCKMIWKPADPGTDANCCAQGACQVTCAERACPVRITAITSLSTSMQPRYPVETIEYELGIRKHGSSSDLTIASTYESHANPPVRRHLRHPP